MTLTTTDEPLSRSAPPRDRAAAYRRVLRQAGIPASVRVSRGTGYGCVDIRPIFTPAESHVCCSADYRPWAGDRCPACTATAAKRDAANRVLLAAFPDHNDRSDSMTDYFDFVFIVH